MVHFVSEIVKTYTMDNFRTKWWSLLMIIIIVLIQNINGDLHHPTYNQIWKNTQNLISTGQRLEEKTWEKLNIQNEDLTLEPFYKLQNLVSSYSRRHKHAGVDVSPVLTSNLGALLAESYDVSDICMNQTESILQGILGQQIWALMIIDTFGKLPSGILIGNTLSIGNYDECLGLKGYTYTFQEFELNNCFLSLDIPLLKLFQAPPLRLGLCVPDVCSGSEIKTIIEAGISMIAPQNASIPNFAVTCDDKNEPKIDAKAVGAIILCSFIGLLMVVGTAFDIISMRMDAFVTNLGAANNEKSPLLDNANKIGETEPSERGTFAKILLAFSVYTNGKKLLNTNQPAGSLTSINGIRFLSMSWVILGHTYVFVLQSAENVGIFYPNMLKRWTFQAVSNALVSVDTFFTLSGLLLTYLFMKEMKKKEKISKFSWGMFYFHRFWRLTPPYMLVLFVDVALSRYFADGPVWPKSGFEPSACEDSWWKNLLYISNFEGFENMCMVWSWYLANDMQFFIISPLMLIPLFLSPVIGLVVCTAFLLASWITTGVLSTHYEMIASQFSLGMTPTDQLNYMDKYYIKPYCRIGPYIVGIVTGYILYKTEKGFRIGKVWNLICWAIAAGLACTVLYGLYDSVSSGDKLSVEIAALYNTTHKSVWAVCICWVIFSCAKGYGGFVNTILSWKGFIPLSRLTYCAYLVHPIIMYTVYYSRRRYYYMTDITMIYLFLANMVAAFAFAFITSLAFESPMMGLEKALLHKNKKQ